MGLGCASLDRRRQRRLSIIAPRRPNRPHIAFHICRRTAPLGRPAMWSPFRTASELKRDHLKRITSQLPVGDLEVVKKTRFETILPKASKRSKVRMVFRLADLAQSKNAALPS